jgi:hypothetical protein
MPSIESLIPEICQGDTPCLINYDKPGETGYNKNFNSVTKLGNLSGHPSDDSNTLYGAEFHTVNYNTPYYETMETRVTRTPWLAQDAQEATFMNRIKELNEEPVQTYKDLELSPISTNNYEKYVPVIYTVEGFDSNDKLQVKQILITILIIFVIYQIIFNIKNNI